MKIDDDFQEYLVEGAIFEGEQDIPCMLEPKNIIIPKLLIPYSARKTTKNRDAFLHCFIHDYRFSNFITETKKQTGILYNFGGVICPDPTISIGGSKTINQAQIYFSRAVGFYLQKNGINAIPCIRWGDSTTFDYCFLGVPKKSIIAISTHGCIMPCKENDNLLRRVFEKGLPVMLERLAPKYIVVYGRMPDDIFGKYKSKAIFINFESDIEKRFASKKEVI